jgi:uncharacterized protein YacL
MGACIGLSNAKFFTQYLLYFWALSSYLVALLTDMYSLNALQLLELMFERINLGIILLLSFGLSFCLFMMLLLHFKLLAFN